MSCLTRSQIETSINDAFNDLITNTALACEQINTEGKHDLWIMAGRIALTHSSGTNTLSWRTSSDRTINAGTLSFLSNPKQIKIEYPSQFSTGGKLPRPISVMALPTTALIHYQSGTKDPGYKLGTTADASYTAIAASRSIGKTGTVSFSYGTGTWTVTGIAPFPSNGLSGTSCSYSSGELTIDFPFKLTSRLPQLTPMVSAGNMYIPFVKEHDDDSIKVTFWDVANQTPVTGAIPTDLQFAMDLGDVDQMVDMETTDFSAYGDIWFCGIYQSA